MGDAQYPVSRHAFEALRPLCAPLLEIQEPEVLASALDRLAAVLLTLPPQGVHACADYVLFPLLLMVETWAMHRLPACQYQEAPPSLRSMRVAERALTCINMVVACKGETGWKSQQFTAILQQLVAAMAVPRDLSCEEIRLSCVCSLQELCNGCQVARPRACEGEACASDQSPSSVVDSEPSLDSNAVQPSDTVELLRTEEMAPQLGHVISLLVQLVKDEALAGASGSRTVRAESLRALSALLQLVGDADALAFFVPGIVSGLAFVLRPASSMDGGAASGASAGGSALSEALHTLSRLLQVVLSDGANRGCLDGVGTETGGDGGLEDSSTALKHLQLLASRRSSTCEQEAAPPPQSESTTDVHDGRLRVQRTSAWLAGVVQKVHLILLGLLPPLCGHRHTLVRAAVGQVAGEILQHCQRTMSVSGEMLLECLLSLSMDDWPQVRQPAIVHLSRMGVDLHGGSAPKTRSSSGAKPVLVSWRALAAIIERHIVALPRALQRGEKDALLHAHRLNAAFELAGPEALRSRCLSEPTTRQRLCAALQQCVTFLPGTSLEVGPALAPHAAAATFTGLPRKLQPKILAGATEARRPDDVQAAESSPVPEPAAMPMETQPTKLPNMPPRLGLVGTRAVYCAIAGICRTVGRLLAVRVDVKQQLGNDRIIQQGPGNVALSALVACLLQQLRDPEDESSGSWALSVTGWQRRCASAAVVLNEIMCGIGDTIEYDADNVNTRPAANTSKDVLPIAVCVVAEYMSPSVWDLPTTSEAASLQGAQVEPSMLELADNALLLQILIEGVGVAAQVVRSDFVRHVQLLPSALYPLLERLGDPNPLVSAAAAQSLHCIAGHCGYRTLDQLVVCNGDYLVDALCRQLRHLHTHPHAPQLFAALLRHTGAAPQLLSLLAEPARAAIAGLQVAGRHDHPQHTAAFLAALLEITRASSKTLASALAVIKKAPASSKSAPPGRTRAAEEEARAGAAPVTGTSTSRELRPSTADIREYFLNHCGMGEGQEPQQSTGSAGDSSLSDGHVSASEEPEGTRSEIEDGSLLGLSQEQLRQITLGAQLADSAAECAAPLLVSSQVRVVLTALDVVTTSTQTLASMREVEDAFKVASQTTTGRAIENIAGPKLLPRVHKTWGYLVQCFHSSQTPVIVSGLQALVELAQASGGDFLSTRFASDIWPFVQKFIRYGSLQNSAQASSRVSLGRILQPPISNKVTESYNVAEAQVCRIRSAALDCLQALSVDDHTRVILSHCMSDIVETVTPFIGIKASSVLQGKAVDVLLGIAQLDEDLVWFEMAMIVYALPDASTFPQLPCEALFKPVQKLLPRSAMENSRAQITGRPWYVPPACVTECGIGALTVMQKLSQDGIPGHDRRTA